MEPAKQSTDSPMVALIIDEARKQGVTSQVALAFADLESGLDPRRIGDKDWPHRNGGTLYQTRVLEQGRLAANPAREDRDAWVSYGLYQLLAAYHVADHEHPSALLNARTNAHRGIAYIARLLASTKGDVIETRFRYVGCGAGGGRCDEAKRAQVRDRLAHAMNKWAAYV